MKQIHATLVEVSSVGILIIGDSGVGKSSLALGLVESGARLVADDAVRLKDSPDGGLLGSAPSRSRFLIHVRGEGICSIVDLCGVESWVAECVVSGIVSIVEDLQCSGGGVDLENNIGVHELAGVEFPIIRLLGGNSNLATNILMVEKFVEILLGK
ncbi:MAG: hypothetical protein R2684_07690 [Pyrinomonadaceae bacterium]